ncbi:hypothetical protein CAMRE0001_1135 [Campylobacter rectus RM3267]|uniref:Uncharacterized protein n=1 Tax=Campylobacter rectus RM3267 TaxID=553218 RepID=B9D0D4_CAMRE|nr:hypothetical protein CAMRE0001_1135 [Campylobacter rectus RM3267]
MLIRKIGKSSLRAAKAVKASKAGCRKRRQNANFTRQARRTHHQSLDLYAYRIFKFKNAKNKI